MIRLIFKVTCHLTFISGGKINSLSKISCLLFSFECLHNIQKCMRNFCFVLLCPRYQCNSSLLQEAATRVVFLKLLNSLFIAVGESCGINGSAASVQSPWLVPVEAESCLCMAEIQVGLCCLST